MKKNRPVIVKNLEHLKNLTNGRSKNFSILLNYGVRSSKQIEYDAVSNRFFVLNEIDDTSQTLTPDELMNKKFSNIGEAIEKKAFYLN